MRKVRQNALGLMSRLLLVLALCGVPASIYAQASRTVTGTVIDETGEPLIGASIQAVGANTGVVTDIDGFYSIKIPASVGELLFSYVGYNSKTVKVTSDRIDVAMEPDNKVLDEVVVIGYGTRKKDDLTGSVASVSEKDFNQGVISSPEELINGKIAGVQITNNGGSANGSSTIRVRGGASLNASNDPLIVLDGVPMEVGGGVTGSGNFLSLINPNDIESMTILKDASSTAIYGSRASNGVIIITTKKGSGEGVKVSFSTTNSLSHLAKSTPTLSYDQFKDAINTFGSDNQRSLLGSQRTDWNDVVFRNAFTTDNSLAVSGRAASWLPFRVALGATYQEGILKTDNSNRYTANINLTPSFFNDHLRIQISGKGSYAHNRFAADAIWAATYFDPTQAVYGNYDANGNPVMENGLPIFGGYRETYNPVYVTNPDGSQSVEYHPGQGATGNPLGNLMLTNNRANVWRLIGNVDVDYRLHPLPELRFHVTGGYDYSTGKQTEDVYKNNFRAYNGGGWHYTSGPQKNINKLLTVYANYNKDFDAINSNLDVTVGYDYQFWRNHGPSYQTVNDAGDVTNTTAPWDERHTLLSYYGRLNYTFNSKYLLTATFRRDGSSRFSKANRWGTFPSVALAWRVAGEDFWQGIAQVMNDFKIRASYGVTGQQDGISNYGHVPGYIISQPGAYYWFNGQWIPVYRPDAYNDNLKWETTKSWNFGVDFGFLNNRFSGSVDYYTRKTEDLLATVPIPAGINFDKTMLQNIGNVSSKGVEIALNANIIDTRDWQWNATFNATWQENKITNLSLIPGMDVADAIAGSAESTPIQVFKTGYAPYTFKLYKQIYDAETGRPVEGLYADLNGDGRIDDNDKYYTHHAMPDWIFGFNTSLRWKKWTLSTALRAQVGNYVYNQSAANMGAWECTTWSSGQLMNLSASFADTQFRNRHYESDHYLENASFLKMDNLQLSYNFGKVYRSLDLHISAMVQNVFTITKYSGLDPEINNGRDSNCYPRPRTYSLTLGLNF